MPISPTAHRKFRRGGQCDYRGYRAFISRFGNLFARWLLRIDLRELTTYYWLFDVSTLRRLPLELLRSEGYSYGVELVYYLKKCGVELIEVPIHFQDRKYGTSKIPKMQIFLSAWSLISLWFKDRFANIEHLPNRRPNTSCGEAQRLDRQTQTP